VTSSKELIKNVKNFIEIIHYKDTKAKNPFIKKHFYGWGRKSSGQECIRLANKYNSGHTLIEDGFIRSIGLGIHSSPSFSMVEDSLGIYYDASVMSSLEKILSSYDFESDSKLMENAQYAIELIVRYNISKYNSSPDVDESFIKKYNISRDSSVLIVAQTAGDCSLEYGMACDYSTRQIITNAINENPGCKVFLKIHPDVLSGKKHSDIDPENIPENIIVLTEDVNSISLLKHFKKIYTKTSNMGFEALLVGCECVCYGVPFYSGWGVTDDRVKCNRRKRRLSVQQIFAGAYILYTKYYNPYIEMKTNIIDAIETINRYKKFEVLSKKRAYLFGFSKWKYKYVSDFLKSYSPNTINFINKQSVNQLGDALEKGLDRQSQIYIWGRISYPDVESFANENQIPIVRIEDGFIRSINLGSNHVRPYSLVFDDEGIYFDSTQPSRLENILNNCQFDDKIVEYANQLRKKIVSSKLSKYNNSRHRRLKISTDKNSVILVPGQVESDASIKYGGRGMTNIELLSSVRKENPDSYIIYKPHPDVLSGNRDGGVDLDKAMSYCDHVLVGSSISSIMSIVDEVHTITSLVGFEGLLYGKKVVTYGLPFYAGWGLTADKLQTKRRRRKLSLNELIAGAYVIYPKYLNPKTLRFCSVLELVDELSIMKRQNEAKKKYTFLYKWLFKFKK